MIVDNRGDASHEGQPCRHVQVEMKGLAEPANERQTEEEKRNKYKRQGQQCLQCMLWSTNHM